MAKSFFEIFNDKVSLIYEYDKSTPLFVRKANAELTKNNVDDAIDILINGIHKYSNYPTPYFILGKAYSLKGQFKDAEDAYREGSNLIYSESTFDYYMKEIESLKNERLMFDSNRGSAFLANGNNLDLTNEPVITKEENIKVIEPEPIIQEKEITVDKKIDEKKVNTTDDFGNTTNIDREFDEKLDELANEISSAKMPELDDSKIENTSTKEFINEDPMIVSDTLAKIYEAQNEYNEAIKVYEKLIMKYPNKKEEYTKKIIDLKSQVNKPTD